MKYDACQDLKNQMKRVQGQINGVARMVDEGREATDIIHQITAVRASLSRLAVDLLKEESEVCLKQPTQKKKKEAFDTLVQSLFRVT